ncbi:hypothetical protein LCGC14_0125240 [marine sediment metagenome]|uniref:RNase H type-1 domain-containing protein n=1 Tax=marine sediment metagenome TaxID=412755 RepID=A0A0F9V9R3_9ZZZZ
MSGNCSGLEVFIDGGARGNPGPAAAGVVIRDREDGVVLFQGGYFLGDATNNVAEYTALLKGLARAAELAPEAIEVFSDSELLVRQMNGEYRVRNTRLRELFHKANTLCRDLRQVSFNHIRREQNTQADALVNQALNLRRDVEDAAE